MAVFVIGDLHLSLGTNKPMDVFPGWEGYLPKLEKTGVHWFLPKTRLCWPAIPAGQ